MGSSLKNRESEADDEREVISDVETVTVTTVGSSRFVRIPAHWRRTFLELKGKPLIFELHLERDAQGCLFLVAKRIRQPINEEVKTCRK